MVYRLVSCGAFGTKHTVVQREVFARFYPDYLAIGYFEVHATLYAAVTAMRRDIAVDLFIRSPTCRLRSDLIIARMKVKRFRLVLPVATKYTFIYTHMFLPSGPA